MAAGASYCGFILMQTPTIGTLKKAQTASQAGASSTLSPARRVMLTPETLQFTNVFADMTPVGPRSLSTQTWCFSPEAPATVGAQP